MLRASLSKVFYGYREDIAIFISAKKFASRFCPQNKNVPRFVIEEDAGFVSRRSIVLLWQRNDRGQILYGRLGYCDNKRQD